MDSGDDCNENQLISSSEDCALAAQVLGYHFSSVGLAHAPGGCFWHHNDGLEITDNIGFNNDLSDQGSGWSGVGRVCGIASTVSKIRAVFFIPGFKKRGI